MVFCFLKLDGCSAKRHGGISLIFDLILNPRLTSVAVLFQLFQSIPSVTKTFISRKESFLSPTALWLHGQEVLEAVMILVCNN